MAGIFLAVSSTVATAVINFLIVAVQTYMVCKFPPFLDMGPNTLVFVSRTGIVWTCMMAIVVVIVNNEKVKWPALVWYAGLPPTILLGMFLANGIFRGKYHNLLHYIRSIKLRGAGSFNPAATDQVRPAQPRFPSILSHQIESDPHSLAFPACRSRRRWWLTRWRTSAWTTRRPKPPRTSACTT
jgi:hypothetical protein